MLLLDRLAVLSIEAVHWLWLASVLSTLSLPHSEACYHIVSSQVSIVRLAGGEVDGVVTAQLMYINGLADTIASDKYGGHVFEMTRVIDQDGKTVRGVTHPYPKS